MLLYWTETAALSGQSFADTSQGESQPLVVLSPEHTSHQAIIRLVFFTVESLMLRLFGCSLTHVQPDGTAGCASTFLCTCSCVYVPSWETGIHFGSLLLPLV